MWCTHRTRTVVTAARLSPVGSMATGRRSAARRRRPPAGSVPFSSTVTDANGRFAMCSIYTSRDSS